MKNKFLSVVSLVILSCCCFFACGGSGYVLDTDVYEYRIETNNYFKIPDVKVYDGEKDVSENVIFIYKVSDPDNRSVIVADGSFFVEKVGIYSVEITLAEDKIKNPLVIKVTAYENTLPAPENVTVNAEGVLTFDADNYDECCILIDDKKICGIEKGQNIRSLLHGGTNAVSVIVSKDGKESPASAPIDVKKHETPERPAITDDKKIEFVKETDKTYLLYNCGFFVREILPGENIEDCFETGYNQIAIAVRGTDGILESDLSESADFVCHPKINDLSVSSEGVANFTYYAGFQYDLYIKDVDGDRIVAENIVGGDNISERLDSAVSVGENQIYLSIKTADPANIILPGAETSAVTRVIKLAQVGDLNAKGTKLYFEEVEEAAGYYIYVNGEGAGTFENGDDFIDYIPETKEDFTFSLRPYSDKENVIGGNISEEYVVKRFDDDRFTADNNVDFIFKDAEYQKNNDSGIGSYIRAQSGATVTSKLPADIKNIRQIIELQVIGENGAYPMKEITVSLTDADDPNNVISVKLYRAGDDLKLDIVYGAQTKTGIDANWGGYSVYDKFGGGGYDADKRFAVVFDWETKTISDNSAETKDDAVALENFRGFENGAYIGIEVGDGGGAVVVTELGGKSTAGGNICESADFVSENSEIAVIEENYSYTKNNDSGVGVFVSGKEGGIIRSKLPADLKNNRQIIELQVVGENGAYPMKDITVSLIDAEDPNNVISVKLYRNPDDLKLDIIYGAQTKTGIDANWAGYSVYDKFGGGGYDADKRFAVVFDWETKTISDNSAETKDDATALENFHGFENGAYVRISLGAGGGAAVITEFNGKPTAETPLLESKSFKAENNKVTAMQGNYTFEKNADRGTGLYVAGAEGARVISKQAYNISLQASSVIELQTIAFHDAYDMKNIVVSLIDADDPNNVISVKLYRNPDDLKLDIVYGAQTNAGIDVNWAGYSVYDKCGGGGYDADKRFAVVFDWESKTISDNSAETNDATALENFHGFENGAYIAVEIGEGGGAVVITQLSGNIISE